MAIPTLTDEQVQSMSRLEKDTWWLKNVFRGNMPQLTLRSALTGFLLGGVLSATNLYVGAKTGWTLGVGLTSVILAFAVYRVMARLGARDMTILENNASQSIATAAGYMTGPLISGMAAYMWIENKPMPWWQMFWFNVVLSVLGVLVAFPMKRRFINDEQQPFPEGRACGVVLDTLYTSSASVGIFKAKALAIAALIAGFVSFISGEAYLKALHALILTFKYGTGFFDTILNLRTRFIATCESAKDAITSTWHLPHNLDPVYAWLATKGAEPKIANVTFKQLAINPALDLAMFGAGGLMGIRSAGSMMLGAIINFFIIVPWMISIGEILPKSGSIAEGNAVFGRAHILNTWALWWGISMMVTASMVALFAKPQIFVAAFKGLFGGKKAAAEDPVRHIEVPLWISWAGMPIVGAIGVWMAHEWFGVSWIFGALAIPMIIVLTLIAASSTALTGITPTGSLSKIPQFIFGAADPKHPPTNLMTGVMCVEVASNASNLLMDIKPGYMLGGKPRHQAIGHIIGIVAGSLASTPLFFALFMKGYNPAVAATDPNHLQNAMVTEQFVFPSAVQWKGVSELVTSIFGGTGGTLLTQSIIISMVVAAVVGLIFEVTRIITKNKFPLSPLAIGLGVVVPFESSLAMFAGAAFFTLMHKLYHNLKESRGNLLWIQTHEPICAGIIAGAALVGIGDVLVKVFVLK
ncbi:MAG: OPT/YSL family transporter [Planctomycetes bacterium]|nr:OPT/YSL family transporter [Planctomycetota bacterium]